MVMLHSHIHYYNNNNMPKPLSTFFLAKHSSHSIERVPHIASRLVFSTHLDLIARLEVTIAQFFLLQVELQL